MNKESKRNERRRESREGKPREECVVRTEENTKEEGEERI